MNIVLEGPDNSGKSTLAKYLSELTGIPVRHSGGPSKYKGEVQERSDRFNSDPTQYIYDRHPCVSQNIYATALEQGELVTGERIQAFYNTKPLIIYCRNINGMAGHISSEHSSAEYEERVRERHRSLCEAYDAWAQDYAHIYYRIGDSMERIASFLFDPVRDISEFHRKFSLEYTDAPRALPGDMRFFRQDFLREELREYIRASAEAEYFISNNQNPRSALEEQLDALVDLVYVALGNAHLHGFDFKCAWNRVHQANMQKVRAQRASDSKRGSTFDVVKPEGWRAPSHTDLVENHIHR